MKQYERIIFLHQALREGAELRISSVSVRLGVSNRTVQRDLNQLKSLGVPIVCQKCRYFIASGEPDDLVSPINSKKRKSDS